MPPERSVAIVVDSAASLPAELASVSQIDVVPMQLTVDGKTYLDGRDLSPTDFYRMLRKASKLPTTSAPSPASYLKAYERAASKGQSVVCLTVSPRFSSSYDSAMAAVREAQRALVGAEIVVMDSESAAGSEGLVALEAWRAANRGLGLDEVIEATRLVIPRVTLVAFLDTLFFLWKGGRVPRLAYAGTSLLKIKPLLEMSRGEVRNIGRPRTAPRATQQILSVMHQRAGTALLHAMVVHADAADSARSLRDRIATEFACEELLISEFSPVMGTHTGPGLLGVAFWS